jgi:hypothetical protein
VSIVCCQVKAYTTGRSLIQRSPTDYGVWMTVNQEPHGGGLGPRGCRTMIMKSLSSIPRYLTGGTEKSNETPAQIWIRTALNSKECYSLYRYALRFWFLLKITATAHAQWRKTTAQNPALIFQIRISEASDVNFVPKGKRLDLVRHLLSFCVVFISLSKISTK